MPSLAKMLKKAMVISIEDQVTYSNRTIKVGPHVLVVECATLDTTVPRLRQAHKDWTLKHGGHTIWPCTPSLSSYLVSSNVANRCLVLELGAGMGVCGLIAHKTGASAVVLTDADDTAVKRIVSNIVTNVGSAGEEKMNEVKMESIDGEARPAHAHTLRWGNAQEVRDLMQDLEIGHFDIVLGADLIYPESVEKAKITTGLDIKIRDLFVTAGAALREGGLFLLAHEVRGDMVEVFTIMSRHATANGFGPPQAVAMDEGPDRVVLSLSFTGKIGGGSEKSNNSDESESGWTDLISILKAIGMGGSSRVQR